MLTSSSDDEFLLLVMFAPLSPMGTKAKECGVMVTTAEEVPKTTEPLLGTRTVTASSRVSSRRSLTF